MRVRPTGLDREARHAVEFAAIAGDHDEPGSLRLCGDEHVVGADGRSGAFEGEANGRVGRSSGGIERQNGHLPRESLDLQCRAVGPM